MLIGHRTEILKADVSRMSFVVSPSSIRSDEGLTLETSAFRVSVRWPIYIINSVDKTKFLYTICFVIQGPVARSLVSAIRWLRGIKTYRFPWYLILVSANRASSNPGQLGKVITLANHS